MPVLYRPNGESRFFQDEDVQEALRNGWSTVAPLAPGQGPGPGGTPSPDRSHQGPVNPPTQGIDPGVAPVPDGGGFQGPGPGGAPDPARTPDSTRLFPAMSQVVNPDDGSTSWVTGWITVGDWRRDVVHDNSWEPDNILRMIGSQEGLNRAIFILNRATGQDFRPLGIETDIENFFDVALPSGGGGGGGFGGARAQFISPDPRLVEDAVRATLVALVGTADDGRIKMLTDLYMSEAKRSFKSKKESIDPMASVREKIRGFNDYKAIHDLRPESMDEFQWVSDRRGAMIRAGVAPAQAEDVAITTAKAGATVQQAGRAGEVADFTRTGTFLPGIFQNMRDSARAAAGLL